MSSPYIEQATRLRILRFLPIVLALFAGLVFPCGVAWVLKAQIERGDTDFSAFYAAGKMVAVGDGAHLYDSSAQLLAERRFTGRSSLLAYAHGPFEALLFVPLSYFSYTTAVWLWWACCIALTYLSLFLLLPLLPSILSRKDFVFGAIGFYYPLLVTESVGQDSILTLLLFVICYRSLREQRYLLAGVALALTTYKAPLALPMIAMMAVTSKKRVSMLLGFLGMCVVLLIASVAAVGWSGIFMYPRFLAEFAAGANEQYRISDMPNLRGLFFLMLHGYFSSNELLVITQVASAAVLLVAIYVAYKARHREDTESIRFALFVVTTILIAYHEYGYDLSLLVLPLCLVWDSVCGSKGKTVDRKLLFYSVAILFFASIVIILKTAIYVGAILLFYALICRVLFQAIRLPWIKQEQSFVSG